MSPRSTYLKKISSFGLLLVLSVAMFIAIEYFQHLYQQQQKLDAIHDSEEVLADLRSDLESEINGIVYLATGLSTYLTVHPDIQQRELLRLSHELIRRGRHIRSIGIAPNLVIDFVYPRAGNERALGLDYRKNQTQWPSVKRAIDSGDSIIAGPLNLVQGGRAMIVRTPVYTGQEEDRALWGVTAIVIDVNSLFSAVNLNTLADKFGIAIRGVDGLGEAGQLVYGLENTYNQAKIREEVKFPDGTWVLSANTPASPDRGFIQNNLIRIAGYPVAASVILMFALIFSLYRESRTASLHDPLTGLANRRLLQEQLEQLLRYQQRQKGGFSVICLDLDQFKAVNDNFGHEAGDEVLKTVATRLDELTRASDTVARTGGDEFVVLLPDTHQEADIRALVTKMRSHLARTPVAHRGTTLNIDVSIGWASFPADGNDAVSLLHLADKRMYRDKLDHENARNALRTQAS